jgi:hypothetical protein
LLALRLAGLGHLHAGRTVAIALTRSWWPVTLAVALVSRRARRVAVAAALIPSLLDWWAVRRTIDPARYVGLRIVDDGAYGFGLWRGAFARRSTAALRPKLNGWPRRRGAGGTPTGQQGGMPPTQG